MKSKQLSAKFLLAFALIASPAAFAGKFDAYIGGFNFAAKTRTSSGSKSGFGAYKIAYQIPLLDNLEAGIGYTLIMANGVGGDAAFGFDLDISYFPLTPAGPLKIQDSKTTLKYESLWKPLVSLGYHARQFQSVSTQYNGFSIGAGVERKLDAQFNAKALLRYGSFLGANKGQATEITGLFGISFGF